MARFFAGLSALLCLACVEAPPSLAQLDRSGEVVAELPAGEELRVAAWNEAPELRYVRARVGVRFDGDVRVVCPEGLSLLVVATGADPLDGGPLAGSPLEAAVSSSGARCPEVSYPAAAGDGVSLVVRGLDGRQQPGSEVVVSVVFE